MNIQEIIAKKRDGVVLEKEEISYFIKEYTSGNITDYQAAALVMAMYIRGLNEEETTNLTIEMAKSGEILDLSEISKTVIDKHSTGGVGDKITIILMPIIASLRNTSCKNVWTRFRIYRRNGRQIRINSWIYSRSNNRKVYRKCKKSRNLFSNANWGFGSSR